jgi:cellulose synthase operon protein C
MPVSMAGAQGTYVPTTDGTPSDAAAPSIKKTARRVRKLRYLEARMEKWFIPLFVFAALIAPFPAAAGGPPQDVIEGITALEEESFAQKARGDYSGALSSLEQALTIVFDESRRHDPGRQAELHARGEILLLTAFGMAKVTSRFDELLTLLKRAPEEAPLLKAQADFTRLKCLLSTGRLDEAARLRDTLGFVSAWNLIGPFENERGGGFDTVYGPESSADLTASYDGKERKVSWRTTPSRGAIDGTVNLNALFKPRNQCLAYALCFLETDRAKTVCLRLGSDEAVKVFLNGKEHFALNVRRMRHVDQDAVGLALRKGKNALLIKICDQTGGWGFSARLTECDGSPLEGIRLSLDGAGWTPPGPEDADAALPIPVQRGARDHFEAGAAAGQTRHHLYLAILHNFYEYEGEDAARATFHAEEFLAHNPGHVAGNHLLALTHNRRSEMASERNENPWRLAMLKTLELDPSNANVLLHLAAYYTHALPIPSEARRHIEAALEINPDFLPARLLRAEILDRTGLESLSMRQVKNLALEPDNLGNRELLGKLGDIARAEGRNGDATKYYRSVLGLDFTDSAARSNLISIAGDQGDFPAMLKQFEERQRFRPFSTETLVAAADLFTAGGNYDEAISRLSRAAEINPDDDAILKKLGRTHDLADRSGEALAFYERALDLNPKAEKLRRHVEFLKESAAPFEDAFAVDVEALIAAHPAGDNAENNPHEFLLRQDVYKVNPDGTNSHYHHEVVRVLNDKGMSSYDVFYTFYSVGEEKARIKTARVIHADGTIEEARIDNRDMSRYDRGGRRPAYVDLPPLKPGDVVDIEYRLDEIKQSFFGDYFGLKHYFTGSDLEAVFDSRLTLLLPKEKTFVFNKRFLDAEPAESMSSDGTQRILTWRISDLKKINTEPRMPGRPEFAPCVEVSTYEDWEEMGAWWWQLVGRQCDMNDEMKAKVAELTAGCTSEREKIRAIYNFVVSDIRYSDAWEFGIHGFKPYRASAIFNNRFGDCKDKAILIRSLLGEAGIEAYPVMIKADPVRSREDLSIALVGHFNHAIAYVPEIDGGPGMFLDGTAQFHRMEALPDMDRGATVAVVGEKGCTIRTIPYPAAEENRTITSYDVTVKEDGGATIRIEKSAAGTNEVSFRQGYLNPGKRRNKLKSLYGRVFGEVDVDNITFTDLEDLNVPVGFACDLTVSDLLLKSGRNFQLRTDFFSTSLGRVGALDRRKTDLLMGSPSSSRTRITYHLSGGYAPETLPENVSAKNRYGTFSLTFFRDGNTVTVEKNLEVKAPRVPLADYPEFRDFCREVEKAEKQMIQIRKVKTDVRH